MADTATLTKEKPAPAKTQAAARKAPSRGRTILKLNPMTRVGGALGVQVETDGSQITNAAASGNLYRGYEAIMSGRDSRDAMDLTSRVCGWCGAIHMTTSALALEQAWGLNPPPMATAIRNIALATEAIWVHAAHLAVRAGPDYCAEVMATTNPRIWALAQKTRAPAASIHGYQTIADLMEGLTPVTGRYWTETIPAGRRVQQMIMLLYGKWPHPSVMTPGGQSSIFTIETFVNYFTRLYLSVDYVKVVVSLWDDLIDFLYEADDRFEDLGARPANFIHAGCWDDVRSDNSFESLNETGRARLASPGVMINGKMVTENLLDVHQGIEEFVDHSFYEQVQTGARTPYGSLPDRHPAQTRLIPKPQAPDRQGKYSWCTAPRWRGEVLESTPLGRLWFTAIRQDFPSNSFPAAEIPGAENFLIEPTGHSVKILVPLNFLPETVVEWKIPKKVNTLERLRADAYGVAFAGLSAAVALLKGFELTRSGETARSVHFENPQEETWGAGLTETGRGMNCHWVHTNKGHVENYQIVGPSTWNVSPRDGKGNPGPMEQALIGSPILEEPRGGHLKGIDAIRVIHSFDPCMNCAVQ